MIHIERSLVSPPPILLQTAKQEKARLEKHFLGKDPSSRQKRFDFRLPGPELRAALRVLFNNKCAYCESRLDDEPFVRVDQFRPRYSVRELDGRTIPEGYWWLAYDWANQYLCCQTCYRAHRKNYFPILGKRRARYPERGKALLREKAVLIDPCEEQPAELIWFDRTWARSVGEVTRSGAGGGSDRVGMAIEILGLNREELRDRRSAAYMGVANVGPRLSSLTSLRASEISDSLIDAVKDEMTAALDPAKSFLAYLRQIVAESFLKKCASIPTRARRLVREHMVSLGVELDIVEGIKGRLVERRLRAVSAPPEVADRGLEPAFVEAIEIRNFKGIQKLDLKLDPLGVRRRRTESSGEAFSEPGRSVSGEPGEEPPDDSRLDEFETDWTVLLGENAVGKSSVLEAVALALMGRDHLQSLVSSGKLNLDKLIYNDGNVDQKRNRRTCRITLALTSERMPVTELRITRKGFEFTEGNGEPVETIVRGYGFVRLLPRAGESALRTTSYARCDSLFDPRAALCDVDAWMLSLPRDVEEGQRSTFDLAATTIRELLPESSAALIEPSADGRQVVMRIGGLELSLDQLSAGYQAAITLAADIMSGIPPDELPDMSEAPGIVLIDELGSQLHPRWRMRVVGDLRRAFPKMQFLGTTHEPLCLKGLGRHEVVVLRKEGERTVISEGDSRDPRTMRADQLLTSPFFSLDSTIEPAVDRLFEEYYQLLRIAEPDPDQLARRRELEDLLAPHRGLGYTRSDQLVYRIIDEFLAQEGGRVVISPRVKERVKDIWRVAKARRRGSFG